MNDFSAAARVVSGGVAERAFPAAVVEVGDTASVLWREAFGQLTYDAGASPTTPDTVFDLASLTKVIATTTLAMMRVEQRYLSLEDRLASTLPHWRGHDREHVTIRDLLAHASGLTAHLAFFRDYRGRVDFERAICDLPLEYTPRSRSVYSDLGFMLLGFILEDVGGAALDVQFDRVVEQGNLGELMYRPPQAWRARTAPTEVDPWRGRLLVGEVHDENGWALGGVAGHTGLFGKAEAVGRFARTVLRTRRGETTLVTPDTLAIFTARTGVPSSSRALGWDTMVPTSSCGTRLSPVAIGHTGYTGTSLWIDPVPGVYVVLLTNRVHPTRDNDGILRIRPAFHDAVMQAIHA